MENSDKISKTKKAIAEKRAIDKDKKEYIIEKDYKKHYKKGAKVMLTAAMYKVYKAKDLVK